MENNSNLTYFMNLTLINRFDACNSDLMQFFCREEGLALLEKVESLSNTSGYIHRKSELVHKLQNAGFDCSIQDDTSRLRLLIKRLPDGAVLDKMLFETLKSVFSQFISPATVIANLVKKLGDPEFIHEPVRVSMLKQFIKYTSYHTAPVLALVAAEKGRGVSDYKNNIELALADIDESVFCILDRKLGKDEKKKYLLLRMIDDLANGRYRTNGSTKNSLYIFAFAYNMTAYVNPASDVWDADRDIEKNLLYAFYSNSFLRYISEDYKNRKSDYESEPLGDGINYKNYVEVIYVYCLLQQDKSPAEKIKLAEKLIEDCEHYAASHVRTVNRDTKADFTINSRFTYVYKDRFIGEMMRLPAEEIPQYICNHYEVFNANAQGSRFLINTNNNTAGFHYANKKIAKYFSEEDVEAEKAILLALFPKDLDFVNILAKMYEILYLPHQPEKGKIVHRSDILTAFFYKSLDDETLQGRSLYDLYVYMCTSLSLVLEESRFQPVSGNNIFDLFVLVTLYRHINII